MNGQRSVLISQLKESYGRLLYTYTSHNKEVGILNKKLQRYNSTSRGAVQSLQVLCIHNKSILLINHV